MNKFLIKSKLFTLITGVLLGGAIASIPWYFAWKSELDQANANFFEQIIDAPKISNLKLEEKQIKLTESDLNWSFTDMDGKEVQLADFSNKVVFMNYWATWCVPCIAEFPSLNELYKKYKDNDQVAFLFLTNQSFGKIKRFVKKKANLKDLPYYQYKSEDNPTVFKSNGIPTSIIINTKSEIVMKHAGMAYWDSDNIVKLINDLQKKNKPL